MCKLKINEIFPLVDHSRNFFHVNLYMIDIKLVQELFEQMLEIAY